MLHYAAIALGSNLPSPLGSPEANLREAIERVRGLGRVTAVSSVIETAPVGYVDQPRFLNAALLLETDLAPLELLHALLAIERGLGRVRDGVPEKGPRVIDLDLLLYDDVVMMTPELTLPHLAMADRPFVLAPLAEIAPEWVHPVTGETVVAMLASLRRGAAMSLKPVALMLVVALAVCLAMFRAGNGVLGSVGAVGVLLTTVGLGVVGLAWVGKMAPRS